jgi:membrane associated rhomboid family serine protease
MIILVATCAISLIGLFGSQKLIQRNVFRPYWFLRRKQYETVITSGFVHADLMHLIFNMMTFFFFGFALEQVIGTPHFILLYLAGLLVSHAWTYYRHRSEPEYSSLGASGAVSAILFAAIVFFPQQHVYLFLIPIPIPAPLFAVAYLAYSWWASKRPNERVNHDAHLGGALTGLVYVLLVAPDAYRYLLGSIL